jgi:hypothetical protein
MEGALLDPKVYNLTDNNVFYPGVYVWSGTLWERIPEPCCASLESATSGGVLDQSVLLRSASALMQKREFQMANLTCYF